METTVYLVFRGVHMHEILFFSLVKYLILLYFKYIISDLLQNKILIF